MKRKPSEDGRWPLTRVAACGLGYEDPVRIRRRLRAAPPARAQRTTAICAVQLAKKSTHVESS